MITNTRTVTVCKHIGAVAFEDKIAFEADLVQVIFNPLLNTEGVLMKTGLDLRPLRARDETFGIRHLILIKFHYVHSLQVGVSIDELRTILV